MLPNKFSDFISSIDCNRFSMIFPIRIFSYFLFLFLFSLACINKSNSIVIILIQFFPKQYGIRAKNLNPICRLPLGFAAHSRALCYLQQPSLPFGSLSWCRIAFATTLMLSPANVWVSIAYL